MPIAFFTIDSKCISIDDECGSYTSGYAILEFLWAYSKHINDGILTETQSSQFNYSRIDETIDQNLEQI
jgi:hypothetical protein